MSERRNLLQEALATIERLQARLKDSERALHVPIAIIGAGCRYPGGIESTESLWRVLRDGVDAVSEVPADRWDAGAYYDPDPKVPGKMVTRRGGFLSQVDQFDPQFFGISPREASTMDPQQRLLLETATEALESAGLATDRLVGSATGVFVGITTSDYGQLLRQGGPENSDVYSATGSALNAAAGRLSFTFGFQGPCVAMDTACSSSLVAVHMACQSLRTGESDLALAGGVNVVLSPDAMVLFSKWGMMAPDGACKTFDAAADGFVRAEGCAVIALKRLADAQAAGDPILAVIRGSAVNSDGRSSGLTVPNGPAQQAVLRKALASAGLAPADIDYVEAHGTGTSLGDPIEVEALGAVMRQGRAPDRPLMTGSIKTNIGHAEAASGLAGLLKVVMALRHEAVPPHLHFRTPNPGIPWEDLPITVPTTLVPWPRGERPRRAGVSSFGFSGTNAHVVLEEAPPVPAANEVAGAFVVPLAARNDAALRALAQRHADFLAVDPTIALPDIATTMALGRAQLPRRCALVAETSAELERELRALATGGSNATQGTLRAGERPRIAFLFTGQGAQYAGMGRGLYDSEPVFRSVIDRATAVLAPLLERPLLDVLFLANGAVSPINETAFTQPAMFALEVALAELWRSWGVTPSIVAGHSVGEYAAACVAGVFSFEDGLGLIAERGRLMQALPPGGAMAAVFADEARVATYVSNRGDRVAIAAVNGPEETVLSGDADALAEVLARCDADGLKSKPLEVSHAFHSPRLDPMLDALEQRAAVLPHAAPRIALVSNLTGNPFAAGTGPDARYWRRHAREPVRFAACIEALKASGTTVLVEIGPHPTLLALAARAAPDAKWTNVASLRRGRDERREMLAGVAALHVRGVPLNWSALTSERGGRRIAMPTYPFQRERYWVDALGAGATARHATPLPGHPLLGERRELASTPRTWVWEREIGLGSHPWLADHRVQGAAIVPATAYIEMALAAGSEVLGAGSLHLQQIENLKPMILPEGVSRRLQVTLSLDADGKARFAVHSRLALGAGDASAKVSAWTAHVTALLSVEDLVENEAASEQGLAAIEAARARCDTAIAGGSFYAALAAKGNQWGPCFQGMDQVWIGENEAVGRVRVPAPLADEFARYRFHPAVSDACGHCLVATLSLGPSASAAGRAFVAASIGEMRFHRSPAGRMLWTHACLKPQDDSEQRVRTCDLRVYDENGKLVSETLDARLWYLEGDDNTSRIGIPDDWFYQIHWEAKAIGAAGARAAEPGTWVVFADRSGVGEQIAARRTAGAKRTLLVTAGDGWHLEGDRAAVRPEVVEDYRRLVEAAGTPSVVVHLWSLDTAGSAAADDPIGGALRMRLTSLLQLLHALRAAPANPRPRVWLVTNGAQNVTEGDCCDAPWNAAVWGLGRALSAEHSELWGGLVDLDSYETADDIAARLIAEIEHAGVEDKLAFRHGRRYVARLARRALQAGPRSGFVVRANGTYLITGGLGGIGLAMAQWLVMRGARHLLLIGRTALPPHETWGGLDPRSGAGRRAGAIAALESLGASVELAAIDVAIAGTLERCLAARCDRGMPPVRGVIHAAGVAQFQALDVQETNSLCEALAAKVQGGWRLHRLFADKSLDFFVLCSSTAALSKLPQVGSYAAGNAFLDALAHHRRARGLSALSVNWGTWGEVGMAVDAGRSGSGAYLAGVGTISTAMGLAALGELLDAGDVQAAVMPIDWAAFVRANPMFAADPFLSSLVADVLEQSGLVETGRLSPTTLRAAPPEKRSALLARYLRTEAARVLGFAPDQLDPTLPLASFGFDSLMAVQLKNRIESDLGAVVPMIQFLQGPSVEQLVSSVLDAVESRPVDAPAEAEAAAQMAGAWEEGSL
jgi:acyl transferase domain-containing protein